MFFSESKASTTRHGRLCIRSYKYIFCIRTVCYVTGLNLSCEYIKLNKPHEKNGNKSVYHNYHSRNKHTNIHVNKSRIDTYRYVHSGSMITFITIIMLDFSKRDIFVQKFESLHINAVSKNLANIHRLPLYSLV